MKEYQMYEIERDGHVAIVYLDRPEKRNSLGRAFWNESAGLFNELSDDKEIRAVVLAGKGRSFSSGLDLSEVAVMCPEAVQNNGGAAARMAVKSFIEKGQAATSAPEKCRKPVIAAVHGHCIGAGLDLAAACDIRVCTGDAVFSLREAMMGIIADVGVLQRLPRIVGQGWTRQMAFTGQDVDAGLALEMGLVNRVFKDKDEMMEQAIGLAKRIGQAAPLAVQGAKEVLNFSTGRPVEDGLAFVASRSAMVLPSEDLIEAFAAFLEKRKPAFSGS
ncbi:MAG: crotonase/enoyl-CoA hydratase family protein [Deltaproteobacteria bacterium]|nr:crotonase/enoyl-CoA hydratase family protein [Deltaproteobacteria bacterium]